MPSYSHVRGLSVALIVMPTLIATGITILNMQVTTERSSIYPKGPLKWAVATATATQA